MSGLDGVVVADTVLSHVDGERGELVIRGVPVGTLAASGRFEDAVLLLLDGVDVDDLGAARVHMAPEVASAPILREPAATLRAGLARLDGASDLELVAATALLTVRAVTGTAPAPDADLDHAADLVRMLRGAEDPARARALGAYLCTVSDHGMNASTFAARVVASTGSDATSAVVAAIGALKGPLHGGAPGPVLDMLDAIGTADRAAAWIEAELDAGRRIMGMGHRVYRVRDPRVAVLEAALRRMEVTSPRLALAREVEAAAVAALERRKPGRGLSANVEFATAVLLEAIGLPREAFTATFACGRIAGWLGHFHEQRTTGRLIRPSSRYVGPAPATT